MIKYIVTLFFYLSLFVSAYNAYAEGGDENGKVVDNVTQSMNKLTGRISEVSSKKQIAKPDEKQEVQSTRSVPLSTLSVVSGILTGNKKESNDSSQAKGVVVFPERSTEIPLSSKDQNRIVCVNGNVEDIWTSEEKGVRAEINENEAYVKFEFEVGPGGVLYSEIQTEFFIRCAGETYSLIAKPQILPPQSVYLVSKSKPTAEDDAKAKKIKGNGVDSAVILILQDVLKDNVPDSWETRSMQYKSVSLRDNLFVNQKASWFIPGIDVFVNVFSVRTTAVAMSVEEKDFIDPRIMTNPIALSINDDDHIIEGTNGGTLVIIEKLGKVN